MTQIRQIRLSGLGGQGIVLTGVLLGQAGVMDGKHVSGSNSYGAQARGSQCRADIVFSDQPVDFPHLISADYLVCMSQGTYDLYSREVKEGSGVIFYDRGFVTPKNELRLEQRGVGATESAVKELENKQAANIVLLGAFVEMTGIVSEKAIRGAISMHINERFLELNLKALRLGVTLGRQSHG